MKTSEHKKKGLTPSDAFIKQVMHSLPHRESAIERIGRLCLKFVLSPLWLWTGFAAVVIFFHEPILQILWTQTESPIINLLIVVGTIMASVGVLTRQMWQDLRIR